MLVSLKPEMFTINNTLITADSEYNVRLTSCNVIKLNNQSISEPNMAIIRDVCDCENYTAATDENIYMVIPDDTGPFLCMFPSEVCYDEELAVYINSLAAQGIITNQNIVVQLPS